MTFSPERKWCSLEVFFGGVGRNLLMCPWTTLWKWTLNIVVNYTLAAYSQRSQHVNVSVIWSSDVSPALPWPTGHIHVQERPPFTAANDEMLPLSENWRPHSGWHLISLQPSVPVFHIWNICWHSAAVDSQFAMELQAWGTNRPSLHPSNWTHIRSGIIFDITLYC